MSPNIIKLIKSFYMLKKHIKKTYYYRTNDTLVFETNLKCWILIFLSKRKNPVCFSSAGLYYYYNENIIIKIRNYIEL